MITFNIWGVLYTCGMIMGVFMAFLFLILRKRYSRHIHYITVVFLILSLMLFCELAEESNLVDNYPFILGIGPILDLLIWPFLLFYIRFIAGNPITKWWVSLLYFSPFLVALLWQIQFLQLSVESKLAFFYQGIPFDIFLLVSFKMLCTIYFLAATLRILRRNLDRLKALFELSKKVEFLIKTRRSLWYVTITVMLIYSLFYIQYFELVTIGDSDRIGSLIISGFIYLMGALLFRNPELFLREKYSDQVVNFFKGGENKYIDQLFNLLQSKKLYLNEKLTVTNLAIEMHLTNQQLSYLINRQLEITFLDFINTFRVKHVINSIENGAYQSKTLLALALESGFNSKASFNRIFKDHTGKSPSEYVKKFKK